MKKKHIVWKVILVAVMAVVILAVGGRILNTIQENREFKEHTSGLAIRSAADYKDLWKDTPSDISGLSLWDKYQQGLAVNDGSDTDGDGLTDKEEIELYKSDPLKVSTAGDLYTDAYKVRNGMNVDTYYDYVGPLVFPYNECPEVQLEADSPTDLYAVVRDRTGTETVNGNKVYAQYEVYNYSGKFCVNLADALDAAGLDVDDIEIFLSDGKDLKSCRFTGDGTVITLKKELRSDLRYQVYVLEDNWLNGLSITFGAGTAVQPAREEEITGAGLTYCSPILTEFFGVPVDILYQDLYDAESSQILKDKVLSSTKERFSAADRYYSEDNIKAVSVVEIELRYQLLQQILPFLEMTANEEPKWYHIFFAFYSYPGDGATEQPGDEADPIMTEFDIGTDTLPFGNFRSEVGTTGNCAGISHLTAKLFNTGSFDPEGSYDGRSWNINSPENATLMDRGLSDYKTADFVTAHSSNGLNLDTGLSASEKQFVKMIETCYLQGNMQANDLYQTVYGGENAGNQRSYQLIEEMKSILDSGKILDVYLRMADDSGHTVNLYGYEDDPTDPDVTWFYVYDSNFPMENTGEYGLSDTGFKLKVTKRINALGGEGFDFSYFPIGKDSYGATSNVLITPAPLILVMDENWNDVNPVPPAQNVQPDTPGEDENFGSKKCLECHNQIFTENNDRIVRIICTICRTELTDRTISFEAFKSYDYGYHSDEQLKIMLAVYKAKDIGPEMLQLLNSLTGTEKIGIKTTLFGKKAETDGSKIKEQVEEGIDTFKTIFDTGYALAEDDELLDCMDKDEFLAEFIGQNAVDKINTKDEWEDAFDKLQAVAMIYKLSQAQGHREITERFIDTVDHILSLAPDELLLSQVYSKQLEALKASCKKYFDACDNYENLHFIYSEYLDSELEYVFTAAQMDEFIKPFSANRDIRDYWGRSDMPTLEEVMASLYETDRKGTTRFDRLSPKAQLLVVEYIEFRIHYEFEEITGITLECYYDAMKPETNIFGKPEKFLWFDPWAKAPWEKKIDPDNYESYVN